MIIVTGVSRGVGKAVAELYLEKGYEVIGLGRTNVLEHENYSFFQLDLADSTALKSFDLSWIKDSVTLINNAGIIGNISRISDQVDWDLSDVLQVNTIAPMELAKKVYEKCASSEDFTLVNISSGAANRAIPSWAAYCASKAALNMLSETFYLEEKEQNRNIKVYAVAPGVIDTDMQKKIRSTDPSEFSALQNFIDLKENDQLFSPEECADRLFSLLNKSYSGEVFYDLRNI